MPKKDNISLDMLFEKLSTIETTVNNINDNQEDTIFSFKKACEYLEMSSSYMYKLVMMGKIPHYKPLGKRLYFSKKALDKWIKNNIPSKEGKENANE